MREERNRTTYTYDETLAKGTERSMGRSLLIMNAIARVSSRNLLMARQASSRAVG